jgi:hypothetical protein
MVNKNIYISLGTPCCFSCVDAYTGDDVYAIFKKPLSKKFLIVLILDSRGLGFLDQFEINVDSIVYVNYM